MADVYKNHPNIEQIGSQVTEEICKTSHGSLAVLSRWSVTRYTGSWLRNGTGKHNMVTAGLNNEEMKSGYIYAIPGVLVHRSSPRRAMAPYVSGTRSMM